MDNYDEVLAHTEEADRPLLIAEIEGRLAKWAMSHKAGWQKYERDKFLMVMDGNILEKLEANRFGILDDIREIDLGSHMSPTLSIGVGAEGQSPSQNVNFSQDGTGYGPGQGRGSGCCKEGHQAILFMEVKTRRVERRTA